MIGEYFQQLKFLDLRIFLSSAVFFFIGYALAPTVYYKKITWLLAYPMWISKKIEKLMERKWKPVFLFLFLFSINSFSLGVDFLSGLFFVLPVLFALWTGLNIGLISYHALEGHFFYASLLNPVALLELTAAFISFTLAIQYNLQLLNIKIIPFEPHTFSEYGRMFFNVVLPLLMLSGILETWLINLSKKLEDR